MTTGTYRTADATVSAFDGRAVTPSDSTIINATRGIWIGTGGDLHVTMASGQELTFEDVPGGIVMPLQVIRIYATGTSALGMIALY